MVITQTPLRLSFAGGGTDFKGFWQKHGGAVVSSSIDKYIYVIVKERFDDLIVLNYTDRERVNKVGDIKHELIRESMKLAGVEKGVEITTLGDIPSEGSGLGSSSTVTVGLLHALHTFRGELVTAERLAREACEIEIDILKKPIGSQDQYIAAYGGLRIIEFHKDGSVSADKLNLSEPQMQELNRHMVLIYLNRTRKADPILAQQKGNIDTKIKVLCRMRDMALALRNELSGHNFDLLGRTMHQGWIEKKSLADKISDAEIDELYGLAIEAGALGGKVPGAGGGGFLLLYVPLDKQDNLRARLGHLRELPFALSLHGSRVIFNQ